MVYYLLATCFRRWQVLLLSFTTVLILAIGFSRLYLGVNWSTDLAAGDVAGLVWLIASSFSLEIWRNRLSAKISSPHRSSGRIPVP